MFVYKQLHPAAAIICAVIASAIAVVGATSPSFCHQCLLPPSLLLLLCQRHRRHASYCRHPALNYRHFALNYRQLARVRSKVEFVARIGDCQVSHDNCPPCRHRFKPRNQHKRSLRPRRFGKSVLMPARTQWQHTANPLWMDAHNGGMGFARGVLYAYNDGVAHGGWYAPTATL